MIRIPILLNIYWNVWDTLKHRIPILSYIYINKSINPHIPIILSTSGVTIAPFLPLFGKPGRSRTTPSRSCDRSSCRWTMTTRGPCPLVSPSFSGEALPSEGTYKFMGCYGMLLVKPQRCRSLKKPQSWVKNMDFMDFPMDLLPWIFFGFSNSQMWMVSTRLL